MNHTAKYQKEVFLEFRDQNYVCGGCLSFTWLHVPVVVKQLLQGREQ